MDINQNNYEAWLLDLMEGRLSEEEIQGVRDFMMLNPECALELDDHEPWMLEAGKISFPGKAMLHKEFPDPTSPVTEKDFDLLSIAMLEGDLTENQKKEYFVLLEKDEEKMKEWLQWKQMKLTGKVMAFDRKAALKRRTSSRTRVLWISLASAAAAVVLFFSLFRVDQNPEPTTRVQVENASNSISPLENESIANTDRAPDLEATLLPQATILPEAESSGKPKDPPSLPGQKEEMDTDPVKESELHERPLSFAMLEENLMKPQLKVPYDKIEPHTLSTPSDYSLPLEEERYSDNGLGQAARDFVEEKNISLLSVANAGVEGINRLAGSDLSLSVSRDAKGEVKGFSFRSSLLSIDSPVKKQNISR